MPLFSIPRLKAAANLPAVLNFEQLRRYARKNLRESVEDIAMDAVFDVFLSHKYLEADETLGLRNILSSYGYDVYVDWLIDPILNRTSPTRHNAWVLKTRMEHSRCLLVARTATFKRSVWIPWEVGFMDGKGGRVAVAPVTLKQTQQEYFEGSEYFALYPYITESKIAGKSGKALWICESPNTYIRFSNWLNGSEPYEH